MTTLQKTLVAAALTVAVGAGLYEMRQSSILRTELQALRQQQVPFTDKLQQMQNERDIAGRQLAALKTENERLSQNTTELLKLRSQVATLRNAPRQIYQTATGNTNDPTADAAQAWLERVKVLRQRFDQWPRKTPELQLLSEEDWLKQVADHELDSDEACRKVMSRLRYEAKSRLAKGVNQALEAYAKDNNQQLPTELSQLAPYLNPSLAECLDGYEIAKPGTVHPPKPSSPKSENATTWAMIAKGSYNEGAWVGDGSPLADPEYDMYIVVYNGGYYGYGAARPAKK